METSKHDINSIYDQLSQKVIDVNTTNEEVGIILQQLMQEIGIIQQVFAERLGVHLRTVSRWTSGETRIPRKKLVIIPDAFPELFGRKTIDQNTLSATASEKLVRIEQAATKHGVNEVLELLESQSSKILKELLEQYPQEVAKLLLEE